jgi:hypothetical protein
MGLNETMIMECSQAMAARVVTEGGKTDAERIAYAFRLCTSRKPEPDEQKDLATFLAGQQKRFAEGWIDPMKHATPESEKPSKLPEGVTPTQLASWTALSRVLLNLDETITKP